MTVQRMTQMRAFRCIRWEFGAQRVNDSLEEHLRIIQALEDGDVSLAAHEILDHLYRAERVGKPET
jgi:DNA-binding GntR family transcriptional regulator